MAAIPPTLYEIDQPDPEAAQQPETSLPVAHINAVQQAAVHRAAESSQTIMGLPKRFRCATSVAAGWLALLSHGCESAVAHAVVLVDDDGSVHLYSQRHEFSGALHTVDSAPLCRGWPMCLSSEPAVSSSALVAQEGVPVQLLLGHQDGSLCRLQLPGSMCHDRPIRLACMV